MIDLGSIKGLHARQHELHAYRATCDRWTVLPLAQMIADDWGDRRLPLRVRCRWCNARGELLKAKPVTGTVDNIVAALPRAADLYRNQIAQGLDGSPKEAAKARLLLRETFGGKVLLKRQGQELWTLIELRPGALLLRAACTDGSGDSISDFRTTPVPFRIELRLD